MSLIKKANEIEITKVVKMMIYGQAGMGKSTLALSAPNPLLLDFDDGVKRVNMHHLGDNVGIVQIHTWQDVLEVLQEDLSDYKSIVVDTIGKMMDFIISYRCGSRNPRINDWGTINNDFKAFVNNLSSLKKNVIFVAHRDSRKEGDETVFIPSLREKNYNSIVTELDLLGYLEMRAENGVQKRTITFDPTSRNDGKNTCNLPSVMVIPTNLDRNGQPIAKNDFITTQIIGRYGKMVAEKEEAISEYNAQLAEIEEGVAQITDAASANYFAEHISDYKGNNSVIFKARDLFSKKVKELGLVYDKATKKYNDKADDNEK